MKKITQIMLLAALAPITLTYACKREISHNDNSLISEYIVKAQIKGLVEEPTINTVSFYVFNQNRQLISTASGKINTNVELGVEQGQSATIICVGHSNQVVVPPFAFNTTEDHPLLSLQTSEFHDSLVMNSPPDLFWGKMTITPKEPCAPTVQDTIYIERVVASLTVITRNLRESLNNTTDTDFSYLIRNTPSVFNFAGQYGGPESGYVPVASFSSSTGDFIALDFHTFPLTPNRDLYIDIYKGGDLLRTFNSKEVGGQSILQADKRTVIWINYSQGESLNEISMVVEVGDWSDMKLTEEF